MGRLVDAAYCKTFTSIRFRPSSALLFKKTIDLKPSLVKSILHGLWPLYEASAGRKAYYRELGLVDADRNACINGLCVMHDSGL
jgi:hypothetical protein